MKQKKHSATEDSSQKTLRTATPKATASVVPEAQEAKHPPRATKSRSRLKNDSRVANHSRATKNSQIEISTNQQNISVPEQPAPLYELPEAHGNIKPASFSRLIPNDDILLALDKASYQVPSELLQRVLPATLEEAIHSFINHNNQTGF